MIVEGANLAGAAAGAERLRRSGSSCRAAAAGSRNRYRFRSREGPHRSLRTPAQTTANVVALSVLATVILANASAFAGFSYDDVRFWVGYGAKRAVLVLDWNDGIQPVSLAWGYRWESTATGEDMFRAITNADRRLALFTGWEAGAPTVFGVGYDVDDDGGSFVPGVPGIGTETGYATDPGDHYREGWYSGFWYYVLGTGEPYNGGTWTQSGKGFSVRALSDGSWDGWSYSTVRWPPPTNDPPGLCVAALPTARLTVPLQVASAHGAPTPGEGEHDLNAGTLLTCSVAGSPDPIGDGARSLCTGWEGKGSLPPVGTATNTLPFGLTAATTVTWLWKTQYWVEASADAGGTVAPTNAWRDSGSAVTLTASAPQGFIFTAWTGDATCRSNPLVLPVNRPYRLTARFTPEAPRLSSIELNPGTPAGSWQVGYSVRSNVPPPVVEWISNPLTGQWSTNGVTQAGPVVPGTNGLWTGSAQGPLGEGAVLMRLRIGDGP